MKSLLRFRTVLLVLVVGGGGLAPAVRAGEFPPTRHDFVAQSGDVLAYALPVAAFSFTLALRDREGSWQLGESAAITMGLTLALKYSVHATRPNGGPHAFPSGHTAISFSTAEFLRKRYGWRFGLPAYALAAYVGYSRVHAREHRFGDVAAGALLGAGMSYFTTTLYHGWILQPIVDVHAYGFMASREF